MADRITSAALAVSVVLALAGLCGCGPSLDDVVWPHADAARARLAQLDKVLAHCRDQPALGADDAPEKLDGVVLADHLDRPGGNARSLWLNAFDGEGEYAEPIESQYTMAANWWYQSRRALADSPPRFTDGELERLSDDLKHLLETEYVLVIKTVEYEAPSRSDMGEDYYDLGKMSGEAHLYRLGDAERLAAVRFFAFGQVIGPGMLDFGITSDDPQTNILALKRRLFGDIDKFAQATLAKRVAGVDSMFELEETGPYLADKVKRREVK